MFFIAQKYEAASSLSYYLFESAGVTAGGLFMLAIILVIASFKLHTEKAKKIAIYTAVSAFVISILNVGIAQQVTTDHEVIQNEMAKLLEAVNVPFDKAYIEKVIHDEMKGSQGGSQYSKRVTLDRAEHYSSLLKDGKIGLLKNTGYIKSDTQAKTVITLMVEMDQGGVTVSHVPRFEIYWEKSGDLWQVVRGRHIQFGKPPTND